MGYFWKATFNISGKKGGVFCNDEYLQNIHNYFNSILFMGRPIFQPRVFQTLADSKQSHETGTELTLKKNNLVPH